MITLDTNVLLRYLLGDIKEQSRLAKEVIESDVQKYIPDVVFPEIEYVLRGFYGAPREKIAVAFEAFTSSQSIVVSPYLVLAVLFFKTSNLDMADCIVAAKSMSFQQGSLFSFDKKLLIIEGVTPYVKDVTS